MRVTGAIVVLILTLGGCPNDDPEPDEALDGGVSFVGGETASGGTKAQDAAAAGDARDAEANDTDDVSVDEDTTATAEEDSGPAFAYPCTPGAVESCVTVCSSAGKQLCLKEWGPCIPPEEFCGNCADDDCDGEINEGCPPNPDCDPVVQACPVAIISVAESASVSTGTTLHLSAANSKPMGEVDAWSWSVISPNGAAGSLQPGDNVESPTFVVDVSGTYLFTLEVWAGGLAGCAPTQIAVTANPFPPLEPEVGCADGEREGFLDQNTYTHIAACAGAWDQPGITPDAIVAQCNLQGGDDGPNAEGTGCGAPDLCAPGWSICAGWWEVAAKSTTGCAGAVPPDAKPKSLFFAIRQPSENGSVCGEWGDGFNDVFGCGNLGSGLGPDKDCGPLDRVLASTQPNACGFNEAEPPLGPWECNGGPGSDLLEGQTVTKDGCPGGSCQYDGYSVGSQDKGGVVCCRD